MDLDKQAAAPFLSDELLGLRAQQRRTLRGVPEWIFHPDRFKVRPAPALEHPQDALLIEARLRHEAANLLETYPDVVALTEQGLKWAAAERTSDWLQDAYAAQLPELSRIEAEVRDEEVRLRVADVRHLQPDIGPLQALLQLLAWADELAEDDYRDARLPGPEILVGFG